MDFQEFLSSVGSAEWYKGQIVHRHSLPARDAAPGELDHPLHSSVERGLRELGSYPLYFHQAEAINLIRGGKNVIVVTPAASGKSLCYQVPVLQALAEGLNGTALYLFPTKALAQDQLLSLIELGQATQIRFSAGTYDGDTPDSERALLRRSGQVIITNPDMLSLGILPNHRAWAMLLRHLKYVVIDEAHVYRGVFGSHLAHVIRRLRRLCTLYGSKPQFILASATIANPEEHAERLTGMPHLLIDKDGSPYGGKDFLFWNPPVIGKARSIRGSASTEATRLFTHLISQGARTVVFARTRRLSELIAIYSRERLAATSPSLAQRIRAYRAGYLPEDRREIEHALFQGELLGVAATNALELGIDIGDLEVTILTGYPGTVASTWQQAGRSGRSGQRSLSVLVAQDNPLDQFLMRHPEAFFGKPHENALISLTNPYIMDAHLLCAAYEAPLTERDKNYWGPSLPERMADLERRGLLQRRASRWYLSPSVAYPAQDVNIRSTSADSYLLVDEEKGLILEKVEEAAAFAQLHHGAIYLHQGDSYLVQNLDIEGHKAYVKHVQEPYYTVASDLTDIRVLGVRSRKRAGTVNAFLGDVDVSHQVVSFKRKKHVTEEVISEDPLDLPARSFPTVALWFDIPEHLIRELSRSKRDLPGGLHAAEHAAIGVLPLFALCDRNDIGGVSTPLHPDTGRSQVFIYDGHPGGIGIAEKGFEVLEELWKATLQAISECPCEAGCPSCIQSYKCGNNNEPLDKKVAQIILRACLGIDPEPRYNT